MMFKFSYREPIAIVAMLAASTTNAQSSRWGVLDEIARREWTTEKEPRPRISKFRWIEEGRVLEARHGFVSRLSFGDAKFADTVQRFVLDPKTGVINVTYIYEDGRPQLKSVIQIEADGTAIESFTDANGIKKRNIYKSPTLSLNTIERQEMRDTSWASLGTTRKAGLTAQEIAENKRRAEEQQRMAIAEANARQAAEYARIAAEQAERDAQQSASYDPEPQPPMGAVFLQELQGMARQAQADAERSRRQLDRSIAQAQAQAAAERARAAQAEANRMAAENQRRVEEANARQAAIARHYEAQRAAPNPASQVNAQAAGVQGEAERARREREFAESQRRLAEQKRAAEETAQREADARAEQIEAERRRREAEAARRRQAEEQRLAEQRRRQEEAARPVEFKEGVVVCQKQRENYYRCDGPLQVTYSDLVSPAGLTSLSQACGARSTRDLGMSGGYRIFGCGFGIHPTLRDYPGNRDTAAAYGLYISDRATFYCPRSTSAYCRGR